MKKIFSLCILFLFLVNIQVKANLFVGSRTENHQNIHINHQKPRQNGIVMDDETKELYKKYVSLKKQYEDRLYDMYKINRKELKKELQNKDKDKIEEVKKAYIMKNAKLTEEEYQEKFINPFNQIQKPEINDNMTVKEVKELYVKYLQDNIDYFESLLKQ